MSGATLVKVKSAYYALSLETPRMHFSDTGDEAEYHQDKQKRFRKELALLQPALDALFAEIQREPDDGYALRAYSGGLKYDFEKEDARASTTPCRYSMMLSPNLPAAGMPTIELCFDRLPPAAVRRQLQSRIEKALRGALRGRMEDGLW